MDYSKLVELYDFLERTPSKLGKTEKIAEFLKQSGDLLPQAVLLIQGRVYPSYSEKETGIAGKTAIKVISTSLGLSESDIIRDFNSTGDLGLTAANLIKKKRQKTLFQKHLTIEKIFENLRKLGSEEGSGSQDRKIRLVSELIAHASPEEAKYIVRTVLEDLRIGVAEGIIRDAIAKAFLDCETQDKTREAVKAVEWAWFMRSDYSEIANIARNRGITGLKKVKPKLGVPIQPLLGEKSPGLEEALNSYDQAAIEYKYDGMRTQIHKEGDMVWLFTRRLEDVTKAFPDVAGMVKKSVKAGNCIIEGETLGIDRKGHPLPFQELSKRIHRKYGIEGMRKQIPTQTNIFDAMMLEDETLFDRPFRERRKILERIVRETEDFKLAKQLITKDIGKAQRFYDDALKDKQEGVFVKNLEARYHPGRRVAGGWLKVKPIMETLDLVITGGIWGTGKRAGWLGSFILSCRDQEKYLECGMLGTGIKEKKTDKEDITFKDLTRMLKPYVIKEKGNRVDIRPKIVLEVAYEEIQKSVNYGSGFALRFPRLVRLRTDEKRAEDCDSLERIRSLYDVQRGRK